MSTTNEPWFVAERSEALAGVLLTSRDDVRVRRERNEDGGEPDFLVEIGSGVPPSPQRFVVQVKGTTSSNPDDWMRVVRPLFRGNVGHVDLPVCVFVVNVRDNTASYAWAAEPRAEPDCPNLRFHQTGAFHPLDTVAVSNIVDQVKAWYHASPKQVMPT